MLYFCQPRAPHLTASLREQPAQASVPPLHLLFGASDQLGVMSQGKTNRNRIPRQEARFAGPALRQLLRNSAEEPTQASITRPIRSALRQLVAHLPASCSAFYWHRSASSQRMSRYRLITSFLVLPTSSELCPRAGILESRRNNQRPRQPVLPFCRGSTDLVLICGKSQAVLRGISPDYGSWSKWAYSSLGSRSLCLGHSVLPLPCENRRLSMGFCRDIFFLPVRAYRRSIWVSVQASIFLVLLHRSE